MPAEVVQDSSRIDTTTDNLAQEDKARIRVSGSPHTAKKIRLCIAQQRSPRISESFLLAHQERLPCDIATVSYEDAPLLARDQVPQARWEQAWNDIQHRLPQRIRRPRRSRFPRYYLRVLRKLKPDAVLAEYGPTGVYVSAACRDLGIPFIVHFHGFDAHAERIINEFGGRYRKMFALASKIVAVSQTMVAQLRSLGAPADKIQYIPYGVDCEQFTAGDVRSTAPTLLSVGRFVEKKAPHLTLAAFRTAHEANPDSRLRMIGEGPLLGVCKDLARLWNLEYAVEFLGAQPHDVVRTEMDQARCFVQHSVVASDGDSEGMPVAIIEAGACGLPVVATRHAGIPEVVLDDETGLLVDEADVGAMSKCMQRVLKEPETAARLGNAARRRVEAEFGLQQSIDRLWSVIEKSVEKQQVDGRGT